MIEANPIPFEMSPSSCNEMQDWFPQLLHLVYISWKTKEFIIWWRWQAVHAIAHLLYSFHIFQGDSLWSPSLLPKASWPWLMTGTTDTNYSEWLHTAGGCNTHSVQYFIFFTSLAHSTSQQYSVHATLPCSDALPCFAMCHCWMQYSHYCSKSSPTTILGTYFIPYISIALKNGCTNTVHISPLVATLN